MASLRIGGATIPFETGDGNIIQTYESKYDGILLFLANGTSIKQSIAGATKKLKTVITGNAAWAIPPLAGLDYTGALTLDCPEQRSVYGSTTSIDIPENRRFDTGYMPKGYGVVENRMVETDISITDDTATLTPVSGATSYMVVYWPRIKVFAIFRENMNSTTSTFGWSLTCEEV